MISVTVRKKTACFAACIVSSPAILAAVAQAVREAEDMDSLVTVHLTENQVVYAYSLLTREREGIAQEPNAELNEALLPIITLPENADLLVRITSILSENQSRLNELVESGARSISELQAAIDANGAS